VILVDTDVLIANLRGREVARGWLREARRRSGRLSVSVLTNTEIIGGMRSLERREVYELLSSLRPLPVTDTIARRAGELRRIYRRSHASISVVDYVIAATAEVHGLDLATLNTKHFPMVEGLRTPFRA
jgi:predicted nucleic acid-binding protein